MDQIIPKLKNSKHVLLTTHIKPDGDAIGSMIALGLSINALNKKTTLYNENHIPARYRFLPSVEQIGHQINQTNNYDTTVILDCSDLQRIGEKAISIVTKIPVIINIDHHSTNTYFGDIKLIDVSACATAEIVYRLIKKMNVPVNKAIATSIYTGILTDTGSFRFSNTNRAAFTICDKMVALGVAPDFVAQNVFGTYSLGRIKLLNLALDSIEVSPNGKLCMITITRKMFEETGAQPDDTNGFINYINNLEDVKVAVLIQEEIDVKSNNTGRLNVSLRSNGKVDVAKIAASYGGGGHLSASGFSVESKLFKIKHEILRLAEKI